MFKLKNKRKFNTAEILDFNDSMIQITKGYNAIDLPYVGDTLIKFSDIKWVLWDGVPRRKLKTGKYIYRIEKIKGDCSYRGWNDKFFKKENELEH